MNCSPGCAGPQTPSGLTLRLGRALQLWKGCGGPRFYPQRTPLPREPGIDPEFQSTSGLGSGPPASWNIWSQGDAPRSSSIRAQVWGCCFEGLWDSEDVQPTLPRDRAGALTWYARGRLIQGPHSCLLISLAGHGGGPGRKCGLQLCSVVVALFLGEDEAEIQGISKWKSEAAATHSQGFLLSDLILSH